REAPVEGQPGEDQVGELPGELGDVAGGDAPGAARGSVRRRFRRLGAKLDRLLAQLADPGERFRARLRLDPAGAPLTIRSGRHILERHQSPSAWQTRSTSSSVVMAASAFSRPSINSVCIPWRTPYCLIKVAGVRSTIICRTVS